MVDNAKTMEPAMMQDGGQLSDAYKWAAAAVCVAAALGMRYAGLIALWPRDPGLPVSLLTCAHPSLAVVEMIALAAVASALVVAVIGRRLPGLGVVAVGAGLLAIGWSDADWRRSFAYIQQASAGWTGMQARLAAETLGWGAVILAALAAERLAREWLGMGEPGGSRVAVMYSRTSALVRAMVQSHEQWLMLIAAGLAGIVLIEVLYASNVGANLGQGFFIAGVAMLAGVLLGHQVFTVKAIWPAALAWLVPALGGRLWAVMGGNHVTAWMQVGINPLADMLPIQYAAGGTIGGILGLWISHRLLRWREEQQG